MERGLRVLSLHSQREEQEIKKSEGEVGEVHRMVII